MIPIYIRTPSVSVGLPVYNGSAFIADAIASILAQSHGDLELLVSDNASTDATEAICRDAAKADRRVRYVRLPENLGAAYNYNAVFHRAGGRYFKWAAHDDLLHREFLACCLSGFTTGAPPALVYPRAEFIDAAGRVIRPDTDRQRADSRVAAVRAFQVLQAMNMVAAVFGLFRRDVLARTRLIGSYAASDYVLLLETALRGRIVQLDGPPMFQRRLHPGMSREANTSIGEVTRWFDPRAAVPRSPRLRLYVEYLRAAQQLDGAGPIARATCAGSVVGGVLLRRGRVLGGRWRRRLVGALAT